jgi:hypothetical protein
VALEQLIYSSTAVTELSEVELSRLLLGARRRNGALGVTGMLLYDMGSFLQVLEGEPASLEALFTRIGADPRHMRILTLLRRPIERREFGDWAMGFVALEQLPNHLPGYSEYLGQRANPAAAGGLAERVLAQFREGSYRYYVQR